MTNRRTYREEPIVFRAGAVLFSVDEDILRRRCRRLHTRYRNTYQELLGIPNATGNIYGSRDRPSDVAGLLRAARGGHGSVTARAFECLLQYINHGSVNFPGPTMLRPAQRPTREQLIAWGARSLNLTRRPEPDLRDGAYQWGWWIRHEQRVNGITPVTATQAPRSRDDVRKVRQLVWEVENYDEVYPRQCPMHKQPGTPFADCGHWISRVPSLMSNLALGRSTPVKERMMTELHNVRRSMRQAICEDCTHPDKGRKEDLATPKFCYHHIDLDWTTTWLTFVETAKLALLLHEYKLYHIAKYEFVRRLNFFPLYPHQTNQFLPLLRYIRDHLPGSNMEKAAWWFVSMGCWEFYRYCPDFPRLLEGDARLAEIWSRVESFHRKGPSREPTHGDVAAALMREWTWGPEFHDDRGWGKPRDYYPPRIAPVARKRIEELGPFKDYRDRVAPSLEQPSPEPSEATPESSGEGSEFVP